VLAAWIQAARASRHKLRANPLLAQTTPDMQFSRKGYIVVESEKTGRTTKKGVFAGGDIVTGAATVILAMGAGRKAAQAMKAYLGLRESAAPYAGDPQAATLFGIAPGERNYARVRAA